VFDLYQSVAKVKPPFLVVLVAPVPAAPSPAATIVAVSPPAGPLPSALSMPMAVASTVADLIDEALIAVELVTDGRHE
jgi:hypothetical protein